ncbi:MAG: peptide chain release factor N(5)-glutamine methyltransferase [Alphaproteobacteria bacterium]|nr:peptide chain release factor N(5)-glutamine methyltransferase [Alphaproteobacteria bacterium]
MNPKTTSEEDALLWGARALKEIAGARARHEARLLLGGVLNKEPSVLGFGDEAPLTVRQWQTYQAHVQRRQQYEPISRILGRREFWSLSFEISPDTLDPRPDSEILIETVLSFIKANPQGPWGETDAPCVLDFGTGSGCLLVALLTELSNFWGVGIDKSIDALQIAKKNAARHNLETRASFVASNWGESLMGFVDVLISNPPYIPAREVDALEWDVRDYDPRSALTPGATGLEAYEILARQSTSLLKAGGICALEIGFGQEEDVRALFENAGLRFISQHKDLQGHVRCLFFQR